MCGSRPTTPRSRRRTRSTSSSGYDIVVDGTDNFATRYLVNDAACCSTSQRVRQHFPVRGQASVFALGDGPCYRCLFPEPPPPGLVPSCAEGGVLGVLPGLVGTIQATEAIKLIVGIGEPLAGRLLLIDTLGMKFRTVNVRKDPACPSCGTREIQSLIDYEQFCGVLAADADPCGRRVRQSRRVSSRAGCPGVRSCS
jgi:adenylyltransferase/sulfurtransferase